MLQKLFVQNYALIDHLELEFENGLNIITGETGAGKSILLGAFSLILGNRADTSALLDRTKKCIVEGRFNGDEKLLKNFFRESELDFEDPVIVRREISSEGKSRSFINDTPVSLSQLKKLGSLLVDIHSQHETLLLNESGFQLSVVDAFARHEKLLIDYKKHFQQFRVLMRELDSLEEDEKKSKADQDYFRFLFNELEEANLVSGEQEKSEDELKTLEHSEEIKSVLTAATLDISDREGSLLSRLSQLTNSVHSVARYNAGIEEIVSRIKGLQIELKDINDEIDSLNEEINFEPKRIEALHERLNVMYRLQQKHHVKSIEELIELKTDIETRLLGISSIENKIGMMTKEISELKEIILAMAGKISINRNTAIPLIETQIKKLLADVSLPNAILKIENTGLPGDELTENGIDQVRFLFSANKGVAYSLISKVASGGELSRLMLCIKSAVARLISLPTIIFDEIDTGISGETAVSVGKVLKGMAIQHQLIAITHLPQIAGRGEAHYFVFKEVTGKKTFTKVRRLTADERIVEIAKMLSGEKPSASAIENAKELLKN